MADALTNVVAIAIWSSLCRAGLHSFCERKLSDDNVRCVCECHRYDNAARDIQERDTE